MRIVVGVLIVLAVAAAVSGISAYSYHLGLAQGAASAAPQGGQTPGATPPSGMPYPMRPYGYGYGPYGYGFHPFGFGFGFLFPILWIVLLVLLFRALFFRGRWGGARGGCGGGGPQWLEEWHRRQHEPKSQSTTV